MLFADLTLPRTCAAPAGLGSGFSGSSLGACSRCQGSGSFLRGFRRRVHARRLHHRFRRDHRRRGLLTLLMATTLGRDDQAAGGIALMLWSADRRDADGRRRELDDDLPRPRAALARALLSVRALAARGVARVGAEVPDPLVDGLGFHAVRDGAAVRRDRQRRALRVARPARLARRSSMPAAACSSSASRSS